LLPRTAPLSNDEDISDPLTKKITSLLANTVDVMGSQIQNHLFASSSNWLLFDITSRKLIIRQNVTEEVSAGSCCVCVSTVDGVNKSLLELVNKSAIGRVWLPGAASKVASKIVSEWVDAVAQFQPGPPITCMK